MAEENKTHEYETKVGEEGSKVETQDRGLFDFLKKKEEEKKPQEGIATEFGEKVRISEHEEKKHKEEHKEEEKKGSLLEKFHREDSSSCSSSDEEEVVEGGEKRKKKEKKGLKEKVSGDVDHKKEEVETAIPNEKIEEPEDQKKGFLEKIKGKLPGQNKKSSEEEHVTSPTPLVSKSTTDQEVEAKEKKGFLDKIKDKIPGYHSKTEEEKEKQMEKEKESTGY